MALAAAALGAAATREGGGTEAEGAATGESPAGGRGLASTLRELLGAAPDRLRVWMIDCSEGAQVWQLAMLIDHAARQVGGKRWEILATAGGEAEIDKAKAARRSGLTEAQVGEPYRSLYCQALEKRGRLRVARAFARQVFFARLRTPGPLPSFDPFDLIVTGGRVSIPEAHLRLLLRPDGRLAAASQISLAEPGRLDCAPQLSLVKPAPGERTSVRPGQPSPSARLAGGQPTFGEPCPPAEPV